VLLVAAELVRTSTAASLTTGCERITLSGPELRPSRPFAGRLFDVLAAAAAAGRRVGLLVPAVWLSGEPVPDLFSVADHVNLRLHGALTGRWPGAAPRSFPDLTNVYRRETPPRRLQPGARIYSGLTVAGVGDARVLTPFERRAIDQLSLPAASDGLVDAAIVAAHYGLSVAAWCVPVAARPVDAARAPRDAVPRGEDGGETDPTRQGET
jgi:hypothetical protein